MANFVAMSGTSCLERTLAVVNRILPRLCTFFSWPTADNQLENQTKKLDRG